MKKLDKLKLWLFTIIFNLVYATTALSAVPPSQPQKDYKVELVAIFSQDKTIDYLDAKVTIDHLIDPQADIGFVRDEIDRIVVNLKKYIKPNATEKGRANAIRIYLYEPGLWNNNRPFKYDLNDPEGKSETSRLLHYYLKTRLGNCVSMPILHAILGQRLGLDMTIAAAPNHVFVIYTDKNGKQTNLEATSGGHPSRLVWYKKNLPLSDRSIQTGAFMRKLNDQEAVVVMAHDLVAHLLRQKQYKEVSNILPILAKYNSRDAHIYFQHTLLYAMKLEDEFYSKYPTAKELPAKLMPTFQAYRHQEELGLQAATNLGNL